MIEKMYSFWFFAEKRRMRVLIVGWSVIVVLGLLTASYIASVGLGIAVVVLWPLLQPLGSIVRRTDLVARRAVAVIAMMVILAVLPIASARIQQGWITANLRLLAAHEMNPKRMARAERALDVGAQAHISVDADLVAKAGSSLLSSQEFLNVPIGQQTAVALLNYRSFLNEKAAPELKDPVQINSQLEINIAHPTGTKPSVDKLAPKVEGVGVAPESEGAVMESIAEVFGRPQKLPLSRQFYVVTARNGYGIDLDGMRFKNVVFKDSLIFYDGGPVQLEGVYFVNCRFVIRTIPRWADFAAAVLASPKATFTAL